jgi:hypothetical protein
LVIAQPGVTRPAPLQGVGPGWDVAWYVPLSYFFCGADNAIRLQLWATWLLYAVLVDVTDTVAEALKHPFADISMEMVYRALSHYVHVASQGDADDPIAYLVANHKLYGLVKRKKSPRKIKTDTPLLPLTDDDFS